jgi:hypothetical protein
MTILEEILAKNPFIGFFNLQKINCGKLAVDFRSGHLLSAGV